jgi:glutamyl-tRNA synthetase
MSIADLRDQGVEPLAICSLLARMGPSDPIEAAKDMQELIAGFDFKKINRAQPKFDPADIMRLNAHMMHHLSFENVRTHLEGLGLTGVTHEFWLAIRSNIEKLSDAKIWWQVIHERITPVIDDVAFMAQAAQTLPTQPWNETTWGAWTNELKTVSGRKGKDLFMPLRLALTTYAHGPEMKMLLPLIGYDKTRARLQGDTA